jgi:2-polyprenyl-3-methyl-5-hydroxy-6-metoxy-1,4-benzoquinol methylase
MTYKQYARSEIEPLLPPNATRILDVGAGAGTTIRWLKTIYPKARTTGVELNSALENELNRNVDVMVIGGIDESLPQLRTYDLILLLDVLEHLPEPTATLRKLSKLLEPDGSVIVSVPNIAHFSVSIPLILGHRFAYQDSGILDRTHLRFFVEDTAVKLLNDANLIVTRGLMSGTQGSKSKIIDLLTFGLLRHNLTKQYIMQGKLNSRRTIQPRIQWMVSRA